MNQRTILLEVNPQAFFGQQNGTIELLKTYFPKVKIVARGSEIHIFGEEELLDEFERRLGQLVLHFEKYNHLDRNSIERILTSDSPHLLPSTLLDKDFILYGIKGKLIRAQTPNQQKLLDLIEKNDMLFAIGPAGTGKTYTSVALAVRALKEKQVKRIILTRPAVEAGENLGFLPGDLKEKLDPYMQPLYDALLDMIPFDKLNSFIENGIIQIAPLAFMRGRTLDNAFVILDEAQNTTYVQMKMFLTRMGRNAKFIITGDPGQIDLPKKVSSGLVEAIHIIKGIKGIGTLWLDDKDVVRHPLVKEIINAYTQAEKEN
nr:PhoH family protein [uncultured Capnocytophaga sp.]